MRRKEEYPVIANVASVGGGGAAIGLHQAGFDEIVGIDNKAHPNYPFHFIQADIHDLPVDVMDFDFVWASPPCQLFSNANFACPKYRTKKAQTNLIPITRQQIKAHPYYTIENVPKAPIQPDCVLTGPSVGLKYIMRKRHFETSFFIMYPPSPTALRQELWESGKALSITKTMRHPRHYYNRKANGLKPQPSNEEVKEALGIPQQYHMTTSELGEAIPPAYSKYIADYVIKYYLRGSG